MEKEKVYLDSTIPSYKVGSISRDLIIAARQELTAEWWETDRNDFDLYISEVVIEEIRGGDQEEALKCRYLLEGITVLAPKPEIEETTRKYMEFFNFSEKLYRDMSHVAFAVLYEMDYLLTWNFTHLANVDMENQLIKLNRKLGYEMPKICTPEQLRKMKFGGNI